VYITKIQAYLFIKNKKKDSNKNKKQKAKTNKQTKKTKRNIGPIVTTAIHTGAMPQLMKTVAKNHIVMLKGYDLVGHVPDCPEPRATRGPWVEQAWCGGRPGVLG